MASSPSSDANKKTTGGSFLSGVGGVLFCIAATQAVAYPLGLSAVATLAMGIQFLVWAPSAFAQNEKFYDVTGMMTFIVITVFSQTDCVNRFFGSESWTAAMSELLSPPSRHTIASILVLVWTLRLGTFLFQRICRDGHDSRFNGVRNRPLKFLVVWCVQGTWVVFTALPVLALHKLNPRGDAGDLGLREAVGLAIWTLGFVVEVVADEQKRAFKAESANAGKFIDVGLWSRCRHPNYVGEMVIWMGFYIFCSRGLLQGAGWTTIAGPASVVYVLKAISEPMLEIAADKKFGEHAAYQNYKRRTPSLSFRLQ